MLIQNTLPAHCSVNKVVTDRRMLTLNNGLLFNTAKLHIGIS